MTTPDVLYAGLMVLAVLAGACLPVLHERLRPRPPDPVRDALAEVIADTLKPTGPATPAHTRTAHNGHDTMEVLSAGYGAGAHRRDQVDPGGELAPLPAHQPHWYTAAPPRTPQ